MHGYHLQFRPRGSAILADTPEHRCLLVRVVLDKGRDADLVSFGLADNHLHLQVASAARPVVGRLAQRIETALTRRLGLRHGFEPAYIEPVRSRGHAYHLFDYALRQQLRHGLETDPLREITVLPDLLGLRVVGDYAIANVRRFLPRVRREQLLKRLLVPTLEPIVDASPEECLAAGLGAACLPALRGSSSEENNLRRALLESTNVPVLLAHWTSVLGCCERTIQRLRKVPPDPRQVRAIQLQVDLRRQRPDLEMLRTRSFLLA